MSHSVAQKNHLPSEFMSIYSWVKAKLLFFIFVKHPVEREREREREIKSENTFLTLKNFGQM